MAAGKNYLDAVAMKAAKLGMPAAIPYYFSAAGVTTLNPTANYWQGMLPVHVDGNGHFIHSPLDPASIAGLAALVQ